MPMRPINGRSLAVFGSSLRATRDDSVGTWFWLFCAICGGVRSTPSFTDGGGRLNTVEFADSSRKPALPALLSFAAEADAAASTSTSLPLASTRVSAADLVSSVLLLSDFVVKIALP